MAGEEFLYTPSFKPPWMLISLLLLGLLFLLFLILKNAQAKEPSIPQITKGDEFILKKDILAAKEMRWIEEAAYIAPTSDPRWNMAHVAQLKKGTRIRVGFAFECFRVRGWTAQAVNPDGSLQEPSVFVPRSRITVEYMLPARITVEKENK